MTAAIKRIVIWLVDRALMAGLASLILCTLSPFEGKAAEQAITQISADAYIRDLQAQLKTVIAGKHLNKERAVVPKQNFAVANKFLSELESALEAGRGIVPPESEGYVTGESAMLASASICPKIREPAAAFGPFLDPTKFQASVKVQRYVLHDKNRKSNPVRWIAIRREVYFLSTEQQVPNGGATADFYAYAVPECNSAKLKMIYLGNPGRLLNEFQVGRSVTLFSELIYLPDGFYFVTINHSYGGEWLSIMPLRETETRETDKVEVELAQ